MQDKYQDSYKGAPVDGSAFEGAGSDRVVRGGSFVFDDASVSCGPIPAAARP